MDQVEIADKVILDTEIADMVILDKEIADMVIVEPHNTKTQLHQETVPVLPPHAEPNHM